MFTLFLTLWGRVFGLLILVMSLEAHPTLPAHHNFSDPLTAMRWHHRALVVFAPTEQHPHWIDQQAHLDAMAEGLMERDLLVFTVVGGRVSIGDRELSDSDAHQWREDFIAPETHFTLVLIGKDGEVKMHQNQPADAAELFELIDAMPMRMHEMGMGRL
ncbi:DUF4174 domain-containing protein [Marinobacter hydrocarbonoclasticus]|nr:DUF4174 domain-containing protein [Marinobacter nauticus]